MIRAAAPSDAGALLRLIRELAAYEREPDAVEATEESLAEALFCPAPLVHALVAETGGRVVGMAIWFLSFSTWTGRHSLYLEDLFVEPDQRGTGLGRELMRALAGIAVERGCARMDWSVLDWNEPSIGFYRALGARPMDEWTGWRIDGDRLADLAAP
ncbi:MAG TPA: GNAT family N-acetyltransferase [Acidimicrobiales bacterium]|nr:GNAT family N-acetyltransferase [Acidimicrobiales bacterium]